MGSRFQRVSRLLGFPDIWPATLILHTHTLIILSPDPIQGMSFRLLEFRGWQAFLISIFRHRRGEGRDNRFFGYFKIPGLGSGLRSEFLRVAIFQGQGFRVRGPTTTLRFPFPSLHLVQCIRNGVQRPLTGLRLPKNGLRLAFGQIDALLLLRLRRYKQTNKPSSSFFSKYSKCWNFIQTIIIF